MNNVEQFYRDVLPPTGNYYLAVNDNNKHREKSFPDIESFIAAITLVSQTQNNVYFGTASFGNSRTIPDVKEKKCYYLDIDFGSENKIYRTATDAIEGLKEFTDSGDLPKPTYIVTSGHGFHCYWVLDKPIPAQQWLIGAKNLKQFCIDNGLHADHGITGDVARILRAPGSTNVKDRSDPRTVSCHPQTAAPSQYHATDIFAEGAGLFPELGKFIGMDDLSAMPVPDVTYSSKEIIKNCGIFTRSFTERGANDTGEIWGNELLILSYTEDGEKLKHRISDAHPDYSQASTEAKWNTKKNCGAKPTTCDFMAGLPNCAQICAACPSKGTVTSPLHLGKVEAETVEVQLLPAAAAAATAGPNLPDGYIQNKNGLFKITGHDEDGKPELKAVFPHNMKKEVVDLVVSSDTHYSHQYRLIMKDSREFEVNLGAVELADAKALDVKLMDKRVTLVEPHRKLFRDFLMSWTSQLSDSDTKLGQKHMGWAPDHTAFSVGEDIYANGKVEINHMVDPVMQQKFGVAGSFEEWQAKANLVINDRSASAAIVASSLAAPLIGFTRDPGCVFSIHGDSGTGKTTVMKIAQTLWGHPVNSMLSLDDTTLSMQHALGKMRNLPAYWDEVRSSSADERLMQNVFRLTAGRERTRLTSNVEQRETGEWQTILITSSNISALGTIASQTKDSDAGVMRIFEVSMPPIQNSLPDLGVTHCYGAGGRLYAEYLANNADAVKKRVAEIESKLRAGIMPDEPERFRVSLVAAIIAGAELGKKVLDLNFDIKSLTQYMKSEFVKLRASSKQHRESYSATHLLLQYINEMTVNRLISDRMHKKGGSHTVQTVKFPANNNPVFVHIAETGDCLVQKPHFDEWVERKIGLKSHKTKEEMIKVSGITCGQRSLGAGTSFATGRSYCYIVNMADPAFKGMFDELYQPTMAAQSSNVTPIQP